MTPEDQERLEACSAEMAEILYRNSDPAGLENLDNIEQTVRKQMLLEVSPRVALFNQDDHSRSRTLRHLAHPPKVSSDLVLKPREYRSFPGLSIFECHAPCTYASYPGFFSRTPDSGCSSQQ